MTDRDPEPPAGDDSLVDLASAISDGRAVDWGKAESSTAGEVRELIASLREVEAVARHHRPPEKFGRMEVLEPIGRGGFGDVYRAWDPDLERDVALKIVRPDRGGEEGGADPLREARLMAKLRHPNVVTVHGAAIEEGRAGIWMELLEGETLDRRVVESGYMGAEEAAAIGVVVARALAAVHGAGLLHLDLKPRNIVRAAGGRVVLMDFGLGRRVAGKPGERPSGDDAIAGTPAWMAPELLAGGEPDARSDLYSVGALLAYLVTGKTPAAGKRLLDSRADLPDEFIAVVEKAMSKKPADRFATAGEMEAALRAIGGGKVDVAAGTPPAPPPDESLRRKRSNWMIALSSLVLVGIAGAAFLASRGDRNGQSAATPAAPGAAVPAAPPATSAASFTLRATFLRGGEHAAPLHEGDKVSVGDSLSLAIRADRDLYVYVLNQDDNGESWLLQPLPGFDSANPLKGGESHRLPGTKEGAPFYWQVTSAGGHEHFLVVASPERLGDFEADLLELERPAVGAALHYPRVGSKALSRLRGIGGLVTPAQPRSVAAPGAPPRFAELAASLGDREETVKGVWIRRITFANPVN